MVHESIAWAKKNLPQPHFFIPFCVFFIQQLVVLLCIVPQKSQNNPKEHFVNSK